MPFSPGTYVEANAEKVIRLKSDDGGATWYPVGGNPAKAQPFGTPACIRLLSHDGGTTWATT